MRHIPEEELVAYLDQALSRSQCVEIERHLARCGACKRQRDGLAALRDRTTALLARIGPPTILTPAFSELQRRAAERQPVETPRRRLVTGAWAAGIAAAIVIGWQVKAQFGTVPQTVTAAAPARSPAETSPAPTAAQQEVPIVPVHVAVSNPKPRHDQRRLVRATRPVGNAAPEATDFASAIETDSVSYLLPSPTRQLVLAAPALTFEEFVPQPVSADPGLQGLWRTITPDDDAPDETTDIALVPGLPVVQMRQQPAIGATDGEVTAVDQRLESGEMIRTISGPVSRVLDLVDEDARADSTANNSMPQDRTTVTIRQGGRMVAVTGPSQALGSLLSRVNMKQTKRRY